LTITWTATYMDPNWCISKPNTPPCNVFCDPIGLSGPITRSFIFEIYNDPPSANITGSPTPAWNKTVKLNANASDPDGGTLTYNWSVIQRPSGSSTTLNDPKAASPTLAFSSDKDIGQWRVKLDLDDNEGERKTFIHEFTVPNVPPNISITGATDVDEMKPIQLGVSPTTDVDGGNLDIVWDIVQSPPGASHGPQSNYKTGASLTIPTVEKDLGTWVFRATAKDNESASQSREITVTVKNVPPSINVSGARSIDALQAIALGVTPTTDVDGSNLDIVWDLIKSPPSSSHAPQSGIATGPTLSIPTTDKDIGDWEFKATAKDNEGASDSETVAVTVKNLPPEIALVGAGQIKVGQAISVKTSILDDKDGGKLSFRWDIVQVPQSAGQPVQQGFSTNDPDNASITIPTAPTSAGTWMFRLTATDNDAAPDSSIQQEQTVLVDGLPKAAITGPSTIGSLSFPLVLDGSSSVDPDSPCPGQANRCHDTDGRPVTVSPDIVGYTWSLIDVPGELAASYPLGRVDEVFRVPADQAKLNLNYAALATGDWTFQLRVQDGEGNQDSSSFTVKVIDANGAPTAVVAGPGRYTTTVTGAITQNVVLNGQQSFDLDNVLAGVSPGPGLGVTNYQWQALTVPSGCSSPALASGPNAHTVNLYLAGAIIPPTCQGYWTIRLTVTDDDNPAKTGTAETSFTIGNCALSLCIDYPTTQNPQFVEFTDKTDILIYYHLNSVLYNDPAFISGAFTRLDVYHESNLNIPIYTSVDPNVRGSDKGSNLWFHWNGYTNSHARPKPGLYTARITLLDSASNTTNFAAVEQRAIWIAVAEPGILATSDKYLDRDKLDMGADHLNIGYQVTGAARPDQLRWTVRDAANTTVFQTTTAPASPSTFSWDGQVGNTTIPTGNYTIELEALRQGASLGRSKPHAFVVYRLALTPSSGPVSATPPGLYLYVNSDDDNRNGASDLTETAAGEDDLVEVKLTAEPPIPGQLELSSGNAAALKLWDTAAKGSQTALPAGYTIPADPLPPQLFLEAQSAGGSNLRMQITTADGATIGPVTIAITAVEAQVIADTNNDHVIGAGDLPAYAVRVARWDSGYDAANAVRNNPDPDNFVDRDPSRLYLRVRDPSANKDPAVVEHITAQLGTMTAANAIDDNPTDVTLDETAAGSGEFVSRSQVLTTPDLPGVAPVATDDGFRAHDGVAGTVADDTVGDRTHRTTLDGALRLQYKPGGAATSKTWDTPVCTRTPEERRKVELKVTVFNEPFNNVGYDHDANPATPPVGAGLDPMTGKPKFDYNDTNMNGQHDAGEASEPFLDLSSGAVVYATVGSRGGVVDQVHVNAQLARANIAWMQACIKIVSLGTRFVDAPRDGAGLDIFADMVFSGPGLDAPGTDEAILVAAYAPAATIDVAEVFFISPMMVGNGVSRTPSDHIPGLGEKTFIYMAPNLDLRFRTLSHELGHALGNDWDTPNPPYIFYPFSAAVVTDDAVNRRRRLSLVTVNNSRTTRPAGNMAATGNQLLKPP
jgi:hypothetical protein